MCKINYLIKTFHTVNKILRHYIIVDLTKDM